MVFHPETTESNVIYVLSPELRDRHAVERAQPPLPTVLPVAEALAPGAKNEQCHTQAQQAHPLLLTYPLARGLLRGLNGRGD